MPKRYDRSGQSFGLERSGDVCVYVTLHIHIHIHIHPVCYLHPRTHAPTNPPTHHGSTAPSAISRSTQPLAYLQPQLASRTTEGTYVTHHSRYLHPRHIPSGWTLAPVISFSSPRINTLAFTSMGSPLATPALAASFVPLGHSHRPSAV